MALPMGILSRPSDDDCARSVNDEKASADPKVVHDTIDLLVRDCLLRSRTIEGTSRVCLCFGNGKPVLAGYTDADMAGDVDSIKSASSAKNIAANKERFNVLIQLLDEHRIIPISIPLAKRSRARALSSSDDSALPVG
ncbi:Retrovirus-related Pol polyprotein from transposon TNT 1-94 [Sesamum alatum]|uniref:Retrovirus-related Pol polyprotein from transposon TNT 1-94 n=1 Tax=Sesamum alatum TaxID=300844 RepID=A0AAE1XMT4_9LAMI|nr:Retrovirus-related Pol polyprotein from transposon TNT 1-94 [Sesamum alatum]